MTVTKPVFVHCSLFIYTMCRL